LPDFGLLIGDDLGGGFAALHAAAAEPSHNTRPVKWKPRVVRDCANGPRRGVAEP
jgi:hypothetical protein